MCVILVSDTQRLTDRMLKDAVDANPDGNGFAWIDGKAVRFEKGITLDRAGELAATVRLPYIFHARIATVGRAEPALCHPFPLDRRLNATQLVGRSTRGVLFHNGTWADWRRHVTPSADGPWSDSRAMADMVAEFGADALDTTVGDSQRVVLLTPGGVRCYGAGWRETSAGIFASNTWWCRRAAMMRGEQSGAERFALQG